MQIHACGICKTKDNNNILEVLTTVNDAIRDYLVLRNPKEERPEITITVIPYVALATFIFIDPVENEERRLLVHLELDSEEFDSKGYYWNLAKHGSYEDIINIVCDRMQKHGSVEVCYDDVENYQEFVPFSKIKKQMGNKKAKKTKKGA